MWSVSKFKVLKLLTSLSLTQAGSFKGSKLFWFLNIHGLLYLISVGIIVTRLYIQMKFVISSSHDTLSPSTNSFKSPGNGMTKIIENNSLPFSPEDENEFGPPPPPHDKDKDGGEAIIHISHVSGQIFNMIMNLVLRILGFILFPKIMETFHNLMSREFCPSSYGWTRNELFYVILIFCAMMTQFGQSIYRIYDKLSRKLVIKNRIKFYGGMMMDIIYCFILEAFPVQCLTTSLIIFTTVVSKNLEALEFYLDSPLNPQRLIKTKNISKLDVDDPVVEFRLMNEFPVVSHSSGTSHFPSFTRGDKKLGQNQIFFVKTKTKIEIKAGPMMIHPRCTKRVKENDGSGRMETNNLFEKYFEWFYFWKQAEIVTGVATLLIFLHMTVNLCIYTFIGISAYSDEGISEESTRFAVDAMLSIGTMVCLGNAAQFLLSVGEELEEKILLEYWNESRTSHESQGYSSSGVPPDDSMNEKQLSYLLHHMSQNPINLSALGFFVASRSTLTSICGVIVTYLVVLIQFKSST